MSRGLGKLQTKLLKVLKRDGRDCGLAGLAYYAAGMVRDLHKDWPHERYSISIYKATARGCRAS